VATKPPPVSTDRDQLDLRVVGGFFIISYGSKIVCGADENASVYLRRLRRHRSHCSSPRL
jgi:hypothetical protein